MDDEEAMSDEAKQPAPEPAKEITPGGLKVPTPTRGEFFANLKKVLRPDRADRLP